MEGNCVTYDYLNLRVITYCDAPSLRRLSLLRRSRTSRKTKETTVCIDSYETKQLNIIIRGYQANNIVIYLSRYYYQNRITISYFLPLKTSLNSPGGACITKLAAMRT